MKPSQRGNMNYNYRFHSRHFNSQHRVIVLQTVQEWIDSLRLKAVLNLLRFHFFQFHTDNRQKGVKGKLPQFCTTQFFHRCFFFHMKTHSPEMDISHTYLTLVFPKMLNSHPSLTSVSLQLAVLRFGGCLHLMNSLWFINPHVPSAAFAGCSALAVV